VGEWATTEGAPTPIFDAALGDAAWLTGLERNSDLVQISAYAPLLVNVNHGASQWGTNLIGYNALTAYASPSYYVQQMFSKNRGDVVLPVDEDINLPTDSAAPRPHGGIGVGAWSTQAEYRNIKVTQADQVLYQKDFATGTDGWNVESGTWQVDDGAFEQTGAAADCRATTGETTWTDYTLTLQARKISGAEGFLIMFHAQDHDNYTWWNIGGWGNTHTAIEKSVAGTKSSVGPEIPIKVESGRWYDIKITVAGDDIKCYLDGKLAEEVRDSHAAGPIYSEASRDKATGDVILKVVNVTASDLPVTINLNGANSVQRTATGEVLAGDPKDTNTIDDPNHIVPVPITITDASAAFAHTFPAHSISVIRVTTK
jgi:alpha-L-arabinofuranosidase